MATHKSGSEPADACLPVTGLGLDLVKPGDVLKFFDARGASRSLKIIKPVDKHWWAESNQTTYMQSGTALYLLRAGVPVQMFPERIGQLPPVEQFIRLKKGDRLVLTKGSIAGEPAVYDGERLITLPRISISLPEVFDDVCAGEAAHMPVIWATQVLEGLAKNGLPSRAEITDAAMGERGGMRHAE